MQTNIEGQLYWTGLPCGPHHTKVCTFGRDYIVIEIDGGFVHAFEEHSIEATTKFFRDIEYDSWLRVRAESVEAAITRFEDAKNQWHHHHDNVSTSRRK